MDLSTATKQNPAKRFGVVVLGLLLGGVAFYGANKDILGLFHDDGIYTVVGQAIAHGDGYRIASLPTAPPQTKYPFLYSYLVSWLWVLGPAFPRNIALLKGLNITILIAIFFVAVSYYRRYSSDSTAAAVLFATLVCTNPMVFGFTDYVLSDLLLVLLTLIALTLSSGGRDLRTPMSQVFLLAAVAGLACLTRTAALPLVIAGAVYSFVVRGWRGWAAFLFGVAAIYTPWLLWLSARSQEPMGSLFAYYGSYDVTGGTVSGSATLISSYLTIVGGNARYLLDSFDLLFLLPLLPGFGYLVAIFIAIGMAVSARRDEAFAWSFFLSSLALLLVWPFHPGRYLAPLIPLLILFLFLGMMRTRSWLDATMRDYRPGLWLANFAWCPVVIALLLNSVWLSSFLLIRDERTTRGLYGNRMPYSWAGFEETFAWLRAHAAPGAVLATAYDPMYYLYTGRQAIRPALHRPATYFYPYREAKPDVGSVEEIKPQLEKLRVDYLIIDPLDGYAEGKATVKLFDEIVESFGNGTEKVFTSADGKHRIYRIGRN